MGYYSDFTIEIKDCEKNKELIEDLKNELEEISGYEFDESYFEFDKNFMLDSVKWYDFDKHIRTIMFKEKYKSLKITAFRRGEDYEDDVLFMIYNGEISELQKVVRYKGDKLFETNSIDFL